MTAWTSGRLLPCAALDGPSGPRSVVRPGHQAPQLTVVDRVLMARGVLASRRTCERSGYPVTSASLSRSGLGATRWIPLSTGVVVAWLTPRRAIHHDYLSRRDG